MARFLKQGRDADAIAADDAKVRATVEGILADIAARGDAAVRELSVKFDRWDREDFQLTDREIQDALAELTQRDIDDVKFAQVQVRNFAQAQKEALRDIEVETLPGVVLGHKNIPVNSIGCYVPGGKYPWWPPRICRS
jgi:sulfopropanediol 3-dehydrogenase